MGAVRGSDRAQRPVRSAHRGPLPRAAPRAGASESGSCYRSLTHKNWGFEVYIAIIYFKNNDFIKKNTL